MKESRDDVMVDALKLFAQEFGPDNLYNRIVIEEILKELLNIKKKEKKDGGQDN